jgi:MFS family permease
LAQSADYGGSATQLRRAKTGVTAAFIAHAMVASSWVAHIPQVKTEINLSNAALGTALLGAPMGSVAATAACHFALPRWGSQRLVPITLAGYAVAATTLGLARSWLTLFLALALWGMLQGGLDVAMNTQAGTVERLAHAPIMARFHGMWSIGALLGAMIGAACVSAHIGLTPQLAVIGAVVLVVGGTLTRHLIPDQAATAPSDAGKPKRARITKIVAILAAVSFASFLCEGAAADWSGNYLRTVVGTGSGVAALSYAAYTLTMVVTRFGAIRLHSRLPSRRLLPALALLAAVGMSIMLAAVSPLLSVIGFASLGAGVALLVPTAFSTAYSAGGAGSAIAIVAATGWLGYLLGPPLIGYLADRIGLSAALVTIPVMISIAGIAIRYTAAFDAVDELQRDAAAPAA